jgi:uncharacterized protein (TIGR02284 family)
MNIPRARNALVYLYKIVEAGEKGYAVVASNVSNHALKILYKSYAQQRFQFKEEIFAEIQRLGGHARPRDNFLGLVHRGRIDIFAALMIGAENVEKVVLKEVLLGETVAVKAYEKTLKKDLPFETREILERQFDEVRKVVEQVRLLKGQNGKRLVLRLYDSKSDAEEALQSLKRDGFSEKAIEMESWSHGTHSELYKGRGTTILETMISGAIGGGIWGTLAGGLAAIGIIQISAINSEKAAPVILLLAILGLITAGAFIGGMIGLFIGWGIASEDSYVYDDSIKHGEILMRTIVETQRAARAGHIMEQAAMETQARQASELIA